MLDFTSSLYLGLRHPSGCLRPWRSLTLGVPAALCTHEGDHVLSRRLAILLARDEAVLGTSSLHLMWDLFGILSRERVALVVDRWLYPVGAWGVERAEGRGIPVRRFRHLDVADMAAAVRWARRIGRRPVVVSDGFCPACGRAAPLGDYLDGLGERNGLLVVDDTQALGILGRGGSGTLDWLGRRDERAVIVASMAKAFGAPLATVAGPAELIRRMTAEGDTRVYASPPSAAALAAAEAALDLNAAVGDALRARLSALVGRFRVRLGRRGIETNGGSFPVQSVSLDACPDPASVVQDLLARGIRAVLHRPHGARVASVSLLITVAHEPGEIDRAAKALAGALRRTPRRERCGPLETVTASGYPQG